MSNLPIIKVYNIDFDFIIKNYTDKSLWDKEWTLFVFKNYVFTIRLDRIYTRSKKIVFAIKIDSDLDIWCKQRQTEIEYSYENMSINFLKSLINNKMGYLIEELEKNYIEEVDETYLEVYNNRDIEEEQLKEIAENFLDENGVYNDEIREAYIEKYVDDNQRIWDYLFEIKRNKKYTYLTELWLIYAEMNNDIELKQTIRNNNEKDITNIEKEIHEFIEQLGSDEYIEEMSGNLESI